MLILTLIQFPIAFYQRFVKFKGVPTGDVVTGTLKTSNVLSVTLLCAMAFVFLAFLNKKISWKKFIFLSIFLLAPTTINETKGTIIFFPIVLMLPMFLVNKIGLKTLINVLAIFLVLIFLISIINSANELIKSENKQPTSIWKYFTEKDVFIKYMFGDSKPRIDGNVRRFRAILFAIEGINESIYKTGLGYGIGTVMDSKLKKEGEFEYFFMRGAEKMTSVQILWELGIIGLLINFIFYIFVLKDSLYLSKKQGLLGYMAKANFTITIVTLLVSWFYFNILRENVFVVIYWYLAGTIVSRTYITRLQQKYE